MIKIFWLLRAIIYKLFFCKIGNYSYIGKPVFLKNAKNISIGKNVRIFPGIRMETHNNGRILIENEVGIAQNVHITSGECILKIGENSTVLANVFITNIDHNYKEINKNILKQKIIINNTEIGANCFIGYGAAIQAGTILGKQCVVGANSVVRGIFPDYCVIVGAPAKIVKRYNFQSKKWEKTNEKGEFINE